MLSEIRNSAKAVAALVVGFVTAFAAAQWAEWEPWAIATATGLVGAVAVWLTKNTPKTP